jgi:hypothetical protein
VDLRWGITSEQTTEGNTINVCLSEIDRCRPYFIGVLGNRYGWAQPMDGSVDELLKKTFNKAYENFEYADYAISSDSVLNGLLVCVGGSVNTKPDLSLKWRSVMPF